MKIAEIEAQMKQGNCSDKIMELFRTALRRVPESNRCQHCYVTASAMPLQCHEQALSLIAFGMSEHCCCWVDYNGPFVQTKLKKIIVNAWTESMTHFAS
ncbi:MAG TPA: hypothetical protein IAB83_05645 [Candidatus Faecousia faecavium]|nr:hypothetical protein [Candidatus Faecousia faecavium]